MHGRIGTPLPQLSRRNGDLVSLRAFCQGLEWKRVGGGNGLFTAAIVSLASPPSLHWANFNDGVGGGVESAELAPISAQFQPLFARPHGLLSPPSATHRRQSDRRTLLHLSPQLFISRLSRREEKRWPVCNNLEDSLGGSRNLSRK